MYSDTLGSLALSMLIQLLHTLQSATHIDKLDKQFKTLVYIGTQVLKLYIEIAVLYQHSLMQPTRVGGCFMACELYAFLQSFFFKALDCASLPTLGTHHIIRYRTNQCHTSRCLVQIVTRGDDIFRYRHQIYMF